MEEFSKQVTYHEPQLLFHREGGGFKNVSAMAGPAFKKSFSARGLAIGDFDIGGAVDVLISNNDGPPLLLRNNVAGHATGRKLEAQVFFLPTIPDWCREPAHATDGLDRSRVAATERCAAACFSLPLNRYITTEEGKDGWK